MPRDDPRVATLLAAAVCLIACTSSRAPSTPEAATPSKNSHPLIVDQICRGYVQQQKAISVDLMYDQCMYASGYRVPGFTPAPDSPGYQGELPDPALHNGGA
jgi:hypothetical protein